MIKKELELFDERYEPHAPKIGIDDARNFLISSHIRLMEEMVSDLEKDIVARTFESTTQDKWIKFREIRNEYIDSKISHLQDTITNLKKELR